MFIKCAELFCSSSKFMKRLRNCLARILEMTIYIINAFHNIYKEQHAKRTSKIVQCVHLCSECSISRADLILYEAILYSDIQLSFMLSVVFSLFLAKSEMRAFRPLSCLIGI